MVEGHRRTDMQHLLLCLQPRPGDSELDDLDTGSHGETRFRSDMRPMPEIGESCLRLLILCTASRFWHITPFHQIKLESSTTFPNPYSGNFVFKNAIST